MPQAAFRFLLRASLSTPSLRLLVRWRSISAPFGTESRVGPEKAEVFALRLRERLRRLRLQRLTNVTIPLRVFVCELTMKRCEYATIGTYARILFHQIHNANM